MIRQPALMAMFAAIMSLICAVLVTVHNDSKREALEQIDTDPDAGADGGER